MAPPTAPTWRSVAQGNWQIHLKPYPRKSRAWALDGEEEAAKYVLKYAWDLWLQDNELGRGQCPITGLFA
mgnify:CR=1 FL=1